MQVRVGRPVQVLISPFNMTYQQIHTVTSADAADRSRQTMIGNPSSQPLILFNIFTILEFMALALRSSSTILVKAADPVN